MALSEFPPYIKLSTQDFTIFLRLFHTGLYDDFGSPFKITRPFANYEQYGHYKEPTYNVYGRYTHDACIAPQKIVYNMKTIKDFDIEPSTALEYLQHNISLGNSECMKYAIEEFNINAEVPIDLEKTLSLKEIIYKNKFNNWSLC